MTARVFEDSAGEVWEVFEVHRASPARFTVSADLEHGWLAFVSENSKRRLAPVPPAWESIPAADLERLCASARRVPAARLLDAPFRPRVRRTAEAVPRDTGAREVEAAVRDFAHQARARKLQAIEAMVELRAVLGQKFPQPDSVARDMHLVRRWFVDSYYFERDA